MSKKTLLKQVLFGRIQRTIWLCLFLVAFSFLSTFFNNPQKVEAATSGTMNFQARLLQSSGALVPDGYYNVEFKLYDTSSGGSPLWTETYKEGNRVRVANGYLTVNLGALTGFSSSINWDQEHWLTMNIGGTANISSPSWDGEMTPRLKLTAVPYAFMAGKLRQTNGAHTSTLDFISPTASRSIWIPDEDGTICLQGSANCGFVAGSALDYIQNSTSPQTANLNITGNATVGGVLSVPTLDTATAGALDIGTTNATTVTIGRTAGTVNIAGGNINLQGNTAVSAGNSLTVTSGELVVTGRNSGSNTTLRVNNHTSTGNIFVAQDAATDVFVIGDGGTVVSKNTSANAFRIQNAAGNNLFAANTEQMKVAISGDVQIGSVLGSKIFTDGFETGDTNPWTYDFGDSPISTERVRNGKYSAKFTTDNVEEIYQGLGKELSSPTDTLYLRSYVNVDSQTAGNTDFMFFSTESDEDKPFYGSVYRRSSDGALCVGYYYWDGVSEDNTRVTHCSSQVLPLDEWHRVELKVDISGGSPTIGLYYEGAQIINEGIDPGVLPIERAIINLVEVGYGGDSDSILYMDDVAVSSEPNGESASLTVSEDLRVGGNTTIGGELSVNDMLIVGDRQVDVLGNLYVSGELNVQQLQVGDALGVSNGIIQGVNLQGGLNLDSNANGDLLFSDSFESGNMAMWDMAQGIDVSSGYWQGIAWGRGAAELSIANNTHVAQVDIGSPKSATIRGYFNVTDHQAGDLPLLNLYNADGDRFTLYRQFSDGMLCAYNGVTSVTECTTYYLPIGELSYLTFSAFTDPSPGSGYMLMTSKLYDDMSGQYEEGGWDFGWDNTGAALLAKAGFGVDNGSGVEAFYSVDDIAVRTGAYSQGPANSLLVGDSLSVQGSTSFTGKVLAQNRVDSTRAFQIQNAAGTSNLFIADTANTRIGIGAVPANSLLTIGTNTTTADGGITFGTDTNLYRSAASTLKTDGSLEVDQDFSVGGNATVEGNFTNNGEALFSSDSTSALKIQNAAGTSTLLTADTTNGRVSVGSAGTATGQFYVGGQVPTAALSTTSVTGVGVYTQGDYAYVNAGSTLRIFDVSNPASPTSVGTTSTTSSTSGSPYVQGKYAYVVTSGSTLRIFDVSNPASPTSVGSVATGVTPSGVYVQGKYAYVSNQFDNNLQIFDVSNPASPTSVGSVATGNAPKAPYIQGKYAYVANQSSNTLQVFNISNPASPTSVGSVATGTGPQAPKIQGKYAYVVNNTSATLQIFDVSNPASPTSVGSVATGISNPRDLYIQGRYAYLAVGTNMQMIDISNPASPSVVGSINTGSGAFSISVQGRYVYLINNDLQIFDVGGSYIQQLEVGGLQTSTISTNGNAAFNGEVSIQGGLTVGQVAQFSAGIGVAGDTVVTSTSENAFSVQNTSGDTLIKADTTNMKVGIGTNTPQEVLHVMGPDTENNGGKGRIAIGDYCHEDDLSCTSSGTNVFIGEYYVRGSNILEEVDTDVLQLQGKSGIVLTTGAAADKINLEIGASGSARFQNTTDSTAAFQIQRSISAGGGNVLTADTTNTRVLIGSATSPTLSGAQLVVTVAEVQSTLRVGNATNGISFNDTATGESGKLRLYGSARNIKRLVLSPEYAGAVLTQTPAACHASDTGAGSMTAGYDGTANKNYYKWTSSQANCQSYEIVTQLTLPADFDGWATSLGDYSSNDAWVSSTSNAGLYVTVLDTNGITDVNNVNVTPGSASTWVNDGGTFAGTYAANGTMTMKFRLTAKSGASVQLGSMYFNYLSKF